VFVVMVCARFLLAPLLGDENLQVASRERAALHGSHAQLVVEFESGEIFGERAPRQPGIEQRAQEHVPGDPREQIQMQ
jgi:hypothetical protein